MVKWKILWDNVLKCLAVGLLGALTTCTLMLSKGSTLFMVSQIAPKGVDKYCLDLPCDERMERKVIDDNISSAWMWNLLIALIFPDMLYFVQSAFMMLRLGISRPVYSHFMLIVSVKVVQTFGMCFLFFIAMPSLTTAKAAIVTASVGWVPGILKLAIDVQKKSNVIVKVSDICALLCQILTVILWVAFRADNSQIWSLAVGLLLTSSGWWEAWLPQDDDDGGPFGVLKKMRGMENKYKNNKKERCSMNLIVSLCKIIAALFFFFGNSEIGNLIPNYTILATYQAEVQTVFKPSQPLAIPLNEVVRFNVSQGLFCVPTTSSTTSRTTTLTTTAQTATATSKILHFTSLPGEIDEAYPDQSDCTAYWKRSCPTESPSLNYTVCPEGEAFGFNIPDYACIIFETCCTPLNETDCGNRTQYNDSCLNMDSVERSFQFPNESSEFTNAEGEFDWSIVLDEHESVIYVYQLAAVLVVLAIQISSTYLAHWLCWFACKSQVQRECFAFPVILSQILILVPLLIMCSKFSADPCFYSDTFPNGIFFNCNDWTFALFMEHNWIFIIAFLSQAWITIQIWFPKSEQLAQVDNIFVGSFYESLLIEQSLIFRLDQNRINAGEIHYTSENSTRL